MNLEKELLDKYTSEYNQVKRYYTLYKIFRIVMLFPALILAFYYTQYIVSGQFFSSFEAYIVSIFISVLVIFIVSIPLGILNPFRYIYSFFIGRIYSDEYLLAFSLYETFSSENSNTERKADALLQVADYLESQITGDLSTSRFLKIVVPYPDLKQKIDFIRFGYAAAIATNDKDNLPEPTFLNKIFHMLREDRIEDIASISLSVSSTERGRIWYEQRKLKEKLTTKIISKLQTARPIFDSRLFYVLLAIFVGFSVAGIFAMFTLLDSKKTMTDALPGAATIGGVVFTGIIYATRKT